MSRGRSYGIDLGGTKVATALIGDEGEVLDLSYQPIPAKVDPIAELNVRIDDAPHGVTEIGIGVPAWIAFDQGVVMASPHRPGLVGVDLHASLGHRDGRRVIVDNDANCAAMSEVGRAFGDAGGVVVNFGTGIGVGVVRNGVLDRGGRGFAGELGHCRFEGEELCACGARGCLETTLRANFMIPGEPSDVSEAKQARYLRAAATGLSWLIRIVDPPVVVIGGGILVDWPSLVDELAEQVTLILSGSQRFLVPRIVRATYGPYAGAVGAAALARNS
ncbi:MAG: ROK family protein [Acidimicrobiales bacterium]